MLPTHRQTVASPHRALSTSRFQFYNVKKSWRTIASLIAAQCTGTIYSSLMLRHRPYEATNTDLLYDPSITLFLTLFLSFQANSFFGLLLAAYNAILLAALLDWPHNLSYKLPKKESLIHFTSLLGIVGMRMLLGYLFGRSTGWAFPIMFFNDSIHETTCGLSVIMLYCIARRAYSDASSKTTRLFMPIYLILWFPNSFHGPVFFWSFSTVSVTGIQALLSLLLEGRGPALYSQEAPSLKSSPSRLARFLVKLKTFLIMSTVFAIISYLHSISYSYSHKSHARKVSNLSEPVLSQFLLLSYPRRNDSTLLSSTLQSYVPSLGSRFSVSVYTTMEPASHPAFGEAQTRFRGASSLSFFPDPDPAPLLLPRSVIPGYLPGKQTLDLHSALSWAERNIRVNSTRYLGIMEDDFEWCRDGWDELKALLYEVALKESSTPSETQFCGIFVATGGSGLLVRPSVLPHLREALRNHAFDLAPDIILQDCLRGALPECKECKLAASRRLLFRHTGASQSTYHGRLYPEDRWQCGWRQPFNGRLGIWVP